MQEPGQIVETYTEEDPEGAMSVVSVETSDDGTTRRTETTVSLTRLRSRVVEVMLLFFLMEKGVKYSD